MAGDRRSPDGIRIAMWSGPRNISTALMRSWGNRSDTFVCDEPLYAHYLRHTGMDHPGAEEIVSNHESDWRRVVAWLTGDIPEGKRIFYQKHMAHHLLPHIDREWILDVRNVFLIRRPREMLTSLVRILPRPALADTGLGQQVELFDLLRQRTGRTPPVVDSRDVLDDPRRLLVLLCKAVDAAFDERMLSWPSGKRPTDGVWAKHWYDAVEKSTGFQPYSPKDDALPADLEPLHDECQRLYEILASSRLGA